MPSASSGRSRHRRSGGGARPSEATLFDALTEHDATDETENGRSAPHPEPDRPSSSRSAASRSAATGGRVVRVLPDEPAIGKTFDYLVPEKYADQVRIGTRVRIALGPRRVGGWIVATDVEPPDDVDLRPVAKLSGHGPPSELIDLAHWAAWRWAGRPATFLRTASPDRVVMHLPPAPRRPAPGTEPSASAAPRGPARRGRSGSDLGVLAREALGAGQAVVRLPPGADPHPIVRAAVGLGNGLVVCPNVRQAEEVGRRLRRDGVPVALHPRDWPLAAAGATVVGTRAAAWAPVGGLAAVVVLDEHDEAHAQEQAPTWHARDVVAERARRAGVPCVLISPCPSLEALRWGELLAPARSEERTGWPIVDVVDRREDDPRTGLFSPALVERLRTGARVLCVLNRTGRARLLACAACGELASCERCDAAVSQPAEGELSCPRCGTARPVVCAACGATRLKLLRQGVSRVREELEALVGEPVGEVTGAPSADGAATSEALRRRVVVGTEAVLHQADRADVVAFLDLDQELLASRYRAAEQALALVARAARLLGGKAGGGRLVLQTRLPRHEVVEAVLHGDPARVAVAESDRRELLRFPPAAALAEVSGPTAEDYIASLRAHALPPTRPHTAADPLVPFGAGGEAPRPAPVPWPGDDPLGAVGVPWAGGGVPPDEGRPPDGASPLGPVNHEPGETVGRGGDDWLTSPGVEILGPADGRWLVRAADHQTLCDALAATPRPPGRLRIAVDPLRL